MESNVTYWIACSGGVDSVVLTHLMHLQKKNIGLLHCNFQLREEDSDEDEAFVRKLAEELQVPLQVKVFETEKYAQENHINTQLAARELRYAWFDEVLATGDCYVVIGQHYDDQVETFFLQLRRGGGVKGLAGIPASRTGYLRPLLNYRKQELLELAYKNGWTWREDRTNILNEYKRNWYRNEVLDFLQKQDFPIEEVVPLMHDFQRLLTVLKKLPTPRTISFEKWEKWPIWYREFIIDTHGLGMYPEKEISRLTTAKKGKFIGTEIYQVWNEGKELVFIERPFEKPVYSIVLEKKSRKDLLFQSGRIYIDASKVSPPFDFRLWQAKDRFRPLGMKGQKSMGKFLRDRKVPAHQKEEVYVLLNADEDIIAVFGQGVGEDYKVDKKTTSVWEISLKTTKQ